MLVKLDHFPNFRGEKKKIFQTNTQFKSSGTVWGLKLFQETDKDISHLSCVDTQLVS